MPTYYSMKEVSEMMNLPQSTIRYYDKEGLLPFIERKSSGYRIFSESDIQMMQIIECFKNTGMSIKEIKHFIDLLKMGDASLEERYNLFVEREKIVLKQMENLQKQLNLIHHKMNYYQTAIEAGTEAIHHHKKN